MYGKLLKLNSTNFFKSSGIGFTIKQTVDFNFSDFRNFSNKNKCTFSDTDEALQVVQTFKLNRVARKHRSTGNTDELTEEELAAKLLPGN